MTGCDPDLPPGGWLGVAGAALLMVACCAFIPLLVTAGGLAVLGGWLRGPIVIAVAGVVLGLAVAGAVRRHRRRANTGRRR